MEVVQYHLNKDIDVFALHDVISKPLTVIPKTCGKMEFPEYRQLCDTFSTLKNIDREQIYNSYLCIKLGEEYLRFCIKMLFLEPQVTIAF